MSIITSIDTVCLGDSVKVKGSWRKVPSDMNTVLHTVEGNMVFVAPGTMMEVS